MCYEFGVLAAIFDLDKFGILSDSMYEWVKFKRYQQRFKDGKCAIIERLQPAIKALNCYVNGRCVSQKHFSDIINSAYYACRAIKSFKKQIDA